MYRIRNFNEILCGSLVTNIVIFTFCMTPGTTQEESIHVVYVQYQKHC